MATEEEQPEDQPDDRPSEQNADESAKQDDSGQFTQKIRHQQVSARVPDEVTSGIYASGSLVLTGPHEFIIDFLQTVTRPHRVAARVILPPSILPNVVRALKQNLEIYRQRFGEPPELPKPPEGAKPPSVQDVYDQLKIDDDIAAGDYANTVMITHSHSEFCMDFITGFYPRSTVAKRIYMSTAQLPRLMETLDRSFGQYQQKVREAQQRQQQKPLDDLLPPSPDYPDPPKPPDDGSNRC